MEVKNLISINRTNYYHKHSYMNYSNTKNNKCGCEGLFHNRISKGMVNRAMRETAQ